MSRVTWCLVPFVLLIVTALKGFSPQPRADEGKAKPTAAPAQASSKATSPAARLAERVDFPGFPAPGVSLRDALNFLTDRYGVPFDVQEPAFRAAGYTDKSVLAESVSTVPMPPMKGVRAETVLRKILSRIQTPPGKEASYLVGRDLVEVTTADFVMAQVWGHGAPQALFPLVHPDFEKRPLAEALKELADAGEHNIFLDEARAKEKAETAVSVHMLNVPLDTAVRLIADAAGLETISLDNVILVTTKENAAALRAQLEKEQAERPEGVRPPRAGARLPFPTAPGSTPPQA
jgi:hypothetical protein